MTIKTAIIINDCCDANAATRQIARVHALLNCPTSFIGVANDLEAAGNLIDTLDAIQDEPAAILVNVAPRHGTAKKWPNGTPFGYFRHNNSIVIASIDGLTLSLVKKLRLTDTIHVLDIPTCVDIIGQITDLSHADKQRIIDTQFRSYEFLPRVAAYLDTHQTIKHTTLSIDNIADAPQAIWWVDNFGNCKTTLLPADLDSSLRDNYAISRYDRLKDVPNDESAFITGSSGLCEQRFLEICVQGKSAAERFGFSSGQML